MKAPRFAHLVLKPTLACTASCATCSTRKQLHKMKIQEAQLGIDAWKKLFSEVNALGLSKLTISGGEPTLYKDLLKLIAEGKIYDWELGLNTNGSLIDQAYARQLKDAGLNAVTISFYSPYPEFHDRLRNRSGLWQKAVETAKIFVAIRETSDPSFRVNMQTLLCKENFRDFPDLIRLAYELRVCGITFSYLEGDFNEQNYLLDETQIQEFKRENIPEVVDIIQQSQSEFWVKNMAIAAVKSIFPIGKISAQEHGRGIYRPPVPCDIPSFFSIILANGDVHPCNMVEYTHTPVVGNLHKKTFTEIWQGETWRVFREKGHEFCRYCPVPEQIYIPIMRRPEFPLGQYVLKSSFFKPFYLPVKRMVFSRRNVLRYIRKLT